jgi:hypothetical protein
MDLGGHRGGKGVPRPPERESGHDDSNEMRRSEGHGNPDKQRNPIGKLILFGRKHVFVFANRRTHDGSRVTHRRGQSIRFDPPAFHRFALGRSVTDGRVSSQRPDLESRETTALPSCVGVGSVCSGMAAPFTPAELAKLPTVSNILVRMLWKEHPELRDAGVELPQRGERLAALAAEAATRPDAAHDADTRERLAVEPLRQLARSKWAHLTHLAARRIASQKEPPKGVTEAIYEGMALRDELTGLGLVPAHLLEDRTFTMVWCATLLAEIAGNLGASGKPANRWLVESFPDPTIDPELLRRVAEVAAILSRLVGVWAEENDVDLRPAEGEQRATEPRYTVGPGQPGALAHLAIQVPLDATATSAENPAEEVWTWHDAEKRLVVRRLEGGRHEVRETSGVMPGIDLVVLASFVRPGESHMALAKKFRASLARDD